MIVWIGRNTSTEMALKALAPCGVGAFLDIDGLAVYRDLVRQKIIGFQKAGIFPYPSWYSTVRVDTNRIVLKSMPSVQAMHLPMPYEVKYIINLLEAHGFKGYVYIVGGYVRDTIIGNATYDIDISIYGDFQHFVYILETHHNLQKFPLGVKLALNEYKFDFTFSRYDYYPSPGKMPVVVPASVSADLERRDFTIGAISYLIYPYEGLIDAFRGLNDLEHSILRYIRLYAPYEDPSRVLRGLRYSEKLGLSFDEYTRWHSMEALKSQTTFIVSRRYFRELENLVDTVGIKRFLEIDSQWNVLKNLTGKMYDTILRYINYIDSYELLKMVLMLVYDKQEISAGYSVLGITRKERKIFEKCKETDEFVECLKREGI